jgi:hypothetical protein
LNGGKGGTDDGIKLKVFNEILTSSEIEIYLAALILKRICK